jgi:glycosyltransferase involved in cell wall biosynthesis
MSRHLALLLPGDPDTPTGGYLYDRRMAQGLRALGWQVEVVRLDDSFPLPDAAALAGAARALAALPDGALALVDGLAFGAMPREAAAQAARLRLVALVHHPLAHETGLDAARAAALRTSEIAALATARAVIATSPETAAQLMEGFGVEAARLEVVEPGTDRPESAGAADTPAAAAICADAPLRLLCVATVVPRKGLELLLQALADLGPQVRFRLDCHGSTTRDPVHAARVLALASRLGLGRVVQFHGECPRAQVEAAYAAADLFVSPAWYEGYGMAVAEAVAHGLPVLATTAGAAPRLLGDDAGLLVPPGDVTALSAALRRLFEDPALRARLAGGARRRAASLPTWEGQAARLAQHLAALPR